MIDLYQKFIMRNVCEITSSRRIFASDYCDEGIPFYRGGEITEKFKGSLQVSTNIYISKDKYNEIRLKFGVPQPGDLLLTSVGTLGSPYVVKMGEEFYFKDGNLTWFRNFKGIDSYFLYYWLLSPQGKEQLKKCTIGTSQSAFTIVLLKEMEIKLPPLSIQRKIADVLSAYDDLIENNARRIAILEEMARNLYQEWFVHLRFPGHKNVSVVDGVPDGWEIQSIGDVIEITGGGTPSTKETSFWEGGEINWFSPSDLTAANSMFIANSSKKITKKGLNSSSARIFSPYSVMMTSRATIGVVSINTNEACTNQGFITCIPNNRISVYQIYFWVLENREKIVNLSSGATFKEISKSTFRKMPVFIADEKTNRDFIQYLNPICMQIESLQAKNGNLRRTRDLLLPKLVSGELDVAELDVVGAALD